jgi:hypothetical protein
MERMIAFCGIPCDECGTFQATRNNDDQKRVEVARLWSEKFKADIKPEDINCDGCHSEGGNLFSHCTVCEIRSCGREKNIPNCAHCDEYVCEKLQNFFQMAPDTKGLLDQIRSSLQ